MGSGNFSRLMYLAARRVTAIGWATPTVLSPQANCLWKYLFPARIRFQTVERKSVDPELSQRLLVSGSEQQADLTLFNIMPRGCFADADRGMERLDRPPPWILFCEAGDDRLKFANRETLG